MSQPVAVMQDKLALLKQHLVVHRCRFFFGFFVLTICTDGNMKNPVADKVG